MSRYPHLVALRAAQREGRKEIAASRVQKKQACAPRALYQRAVEFAERRAFGEALNCFEELVARTPDNVQAHLGHARVLQTLGDHAGARAALLAALVVQPDHGEGLGLLGRSLLGLGDVEQAKECFQRAILLAPRNAEAEFEFGQILLEEGRFEEALEHLERATRLEPGFARAWAQLGSCMEREGHVTEAQDCLERAHQLAPSDHLVARAWGRCLLAMGDAPELAARIQALLSDPHTSTVGLELATTLVAEQGSANELYELAGFDGLLGTYELDHVDGFADVRQFNDALVAAVSAQSEVCQTEGISRSGNLLARSKGPLRDLEELVLNAVSDYVATLPETNHPFVQHRPLHVELAAQAQRISPGASTSAENRCDWLRGIYFVSVPEQWSITELGLLDTAGRPRESPKLLCPSRPGSLLLYPSFWHRCSRVGPGSNALVLIELSVPTRSSTTGTPYRER